MNPGVEGHPQKSQEAAASSEAAPSSCHQAAGEKLRVGSWEGTCPGSGRCAEARWPADQEEEPWTVAAASAGSRHHHQAGMNALGDPAQAEGVAEGFE